MSFYVMPCSTVEQFVVRNVFSELMQTGSYRRNLNLPCQLVRKPRSTFHVTRVISWASMTDQGHRSAAVDSESDAEHTLGAIGVDLSNA
jgi:hypothetical protein